MLNAPLILCSITCCPVDLIDRINNVDPEERILYASMNREAGNRALATPDFTSAVTYSESGLSFLDDSHWETHHDLMLSLYEINIKAMHVCTNSNQDLLKERINIVFQHARNVDEEL